MTFLNPLVLLGLVAAAIPLLIHLFNFRRPKKIDFSSLTFVKELQKTTMQRVRIKQWILLLLRTLAIACLILAFARPTLTGDLVQGIGARARSSIAVVMDNSLSMTQRDTRGEYLAQAREYAAGILGQMQTGDEVVFVTSSRTVQADPAFYNSAGAGAEALKEFGPEPGAVPLTTAMQLAGELLQRAEHINKEMYVISDLQQSTLIDSVRAAVPEDVRVYLLPVGNQQHGNVAVTGVRVVSRIIEQGQPVRIEAALANFGSDRLEDYAASIYLDNERVAQTTVDLDPGTTATAAFVLTPQSRGWLAGTVQIEDDLFEADNVRYFTLHVPESRSLLVVGGEGQPLDYLNLALSPDLGKGRIAFTVESIQESALGTRPLNAYDVVLLVGVRRLSPGTASALAQFVEKGGGLFVFPAGGRSPEPYNTLLGALKGGRITGFSGAYQGADIVSSFSQVDYEHPLFEGIFDRPGSLSRENRLESPDIRYAANYVAAGADEQTVINMSNGFPFLQELRHGSGIAFIAAVAPDPGWSDFPVRGLFIPLLYRSIFYLSFGESFSDEQMLVGAGGEVRLNNVGGNEAVRLVSPLGEEFTPEQRLLFGATLLVVDPAIRTPGVYDVVQGTNILRRIAVNSDTRESNLRAYEVKDATRKLEEATGRPVRALSISEGMGTEGVVRALREERLGIEVWNVFLLFALAFLVAEMLVARKWRPEFVPA